MFSGHAVAGVRNSTFSLVDAGGDVDDGLVASGLVGLCGVATFFGLAGAGQVGLANAEFVVKLRNA